MTAEYEYGVIGLGTMGRNLALNIRGHGFTVIGYDKDLKKVADFEKEEEGQKLSGANSIKEFVEVLKQPRAIILLVPAGIIVDAVIEELKPLLNPKDLIIDLGNSHFTDTNRRLEALTKSKLAYMGIGVSGGEWGARNGPSIMAGGLPETYERVAPMLKAIAAKVDDTPCVALMGPGSAGHYVKMVHNGIEYAIMQCISETYQILKQGGGLSNSELHTVFFRWNEGKLQSYLIEITAKIFDTKDAFSEESLVDKILDVARQKGTGAWASQDAMSNQVPLAVINAAVCGRDITVYKKERVLASQLLKGPEQSVEKDKKNLVDCMEHALYFSVIMAYADGLSLLKTASKAYNYDLNLEEVARIWRGGCIIRSSFLEHIMAAFLAQPELNNIMVDPSIAPILMDIQTGARSALQIAIRHGIPVSGMSAALAYFDAYRTARLPANLIQAQRDFFGAHTYERTDRPGIFHTQWD
jgi:6-phosphogluconate dehydrogenase